MREIMLARPDDFDGWRMAARALAAAGVDPADVIWRVGDFAPDLFGGGEALPIAERAAFCVPRAFVDLAETAILHRDPERFALLYALLSQIRDDPRVLEDRADPLLHRVEMLARAVRRDIHKMRAFVRFRALEDAAGERFVAWFEPEHHIVRANAAFFVRRFAAMRWSILTPEVSVHWDGETLHEGPGAARGDAPADDPVEDVWKGYYAAIFNPARLKVGAMLSEMPKKYWRNLPEAALIPDLIAGAQAREAAMIATAPKAAKRPPNVAAAWVAPREEATGCTRCALHRDATQTVFGEEPKGG